MSRTMCGYCSTNSHDMCKPEIVFYDKVWYCECQKCKNKNDKKDKNEKPNSQDILPEPTTDPSARTGSDVQEPKQPQVETEETNEVG